ncbi:MAG: hypothetical protein GY701_02735 [Sulfitobacter sp.]|nr:hypothetical protein [Sulfitobacter sp.]
MTDSWTDYAAMMRDLSALPAAIHSERAAAEQVHHSEVAAAAQGRMNSIEAAGRLDTTAGELLSAARAELDRIERGQMLPKRVRPQDPGGRTVDVLESDARQAVHLISDLAAQVEGHRRSARERRRAEAEERERIESERRQREAAEAARKNAEAQADARRQAEQARRRATSQRRRKQMLVGCTALAAVLAVVGVATGSLLVLGAALVAGVLVSLGAFRHQTDEKE